MLGLLSGRRKDGEELVNASFADMGVAIDTLLRGENLEDDDEDCLAGLAEAIKMSLPFLLKIMFIEHTDISWTLSYEILLYREVFFY